MILTPCVAYSCYQLSPDIDYPFIINPFFDITEIKFISKSHYNASNVTNMLCLLAEAEIPQLVNDQVFW